MSGLIGLTLVLPCVAQTSLAEKGNPGAGAEDLPQYEKMWTAFIKSGRGVESVPLSDLHVRIEPSGDTAVTSSLLRVKTRSAKGVVSDENFQESDVWFKRNGEWKLVHLHDSPVPKKK